MINLQYHKGQACNIKPILCQEGYCSECFIYQSKYSRLEAVVRGLNHSYMNENEQSFPRVSVSLE